MKSVASSREDDVLRRMLNTPPQEHLDMKYPRVAKPKPSRTGKRGLPKKAALVWKRGISCPQLQRAEPEWVYSRLSA